MFSVVTARAQSTPSGQLREFEKNWAAAVGTNDPDQIGKFFSDDFLFVGAGGILQNRQQHLDDFKSGRLKVESVTITDFTSHEYDQFAVVNTLVKVKGKLGDRDITGDYRFMDTFTLRDNQWLAVARQQTRVQPTPATPAAARAEISVEAANYKFVSNAMDNPPIKVQQGSLIKITLTSRQGSHDWVLANAQGTVLARTSRVSAGQPAVTVEYTASDLGEFTYFCSVGNHRAQGMVGRFIVEANPDNAGPRPSKSTSTDKASMRKAGNEPSKHSTAIARALKQNATSFVLAVRGTDDVSDDYLTWSPTACTIRMVNGQPGSDPVTVTLTNGDLASNPDAGELRFATTLAPRSTATLPSVTLQLNPDGTPVNFYLAGVKPSTVTPISVVNGGRDTKIVVRQGNETGTQLGEHSVMIRVRKALRHPSDPLPKISDFEFVEFLKALRDLHQIDNRLEWYVRLHRLATGHGRDAAAGVDFGLPWDSDLPVWPDQAHNGPGFIAWHRAFLLQFERELQIRYPHVSLPYWVQGTAQTIFDRTRLGESECTGDVVKFVPGSPVYGWSISLPTDRASAAAQMGQLRRRALDHNDPLAPTQAGQPLYRQWSNIAALPGIDQFMVTRAYLEGNPHNNGHLAIGPDNVWMYNCRESNADPVFYVFHCNHDYLWAKWQYEKDRFLNAGSDPLHYSPPDAFTDPTANKHIPLGHHRDDTMWPWDGTTGQVVAGEIYSNRPNVNGFGDFPMSTVPQLWPPHPAQPMPANMIDYEGLLASSNDLGFCYDSVPFGARGDSLTPVTEFADSTAHEARGVALAVISNRTISSDTRLLAMKSLRSRQRVTGAESSKAFSEIANEKTESPELRSVALQQWSEESPADAFKAALQIVADNQSPLSVRLTALNETTRQMHFSEIPHSDGHRVLDVLQTILRDDNPSSLRAAAIRHLAPAGAPLAKEALLSSLDGKTTLDLELPETVSLLRFFPDQKGRLREYISSPNDKAAIAAIQALFNDADSLDARQQLARDMQRSSEMRTAAIQSLMHDDQTNLTDFLVTIAADSQVELPLRIEALASATVRLRKSSKGMTDADKRNWAGRLDAIQTADTTDFGIIRKEAISVVSPTKQPISSVPAR